MSSYEADAKVSFIYYYVLCELVRKFQPHYAKRNLDQSLADV